MSQMMFPEDAKILGDSALCGFGIYKSIEIPDGLESISDYAFSGSKSLKKITIPENVKIGYKTFEDTLVVKV